MGRIAGAAVAAVMAAALALGGCSAMLAGAGAGAGFEAGAGPGAGSGPGATAVAGPGAATSDSSLAGAPAVPASWERLDAAAASTCPGLPWSALAAIGFVESDSGRSRAPGVWSGANAAGAEGPMQFEPATFAAYAVVGPGGAVPPSPYDAIDAVYTAARLLCADGGGRPRGLPGALAAYDHARSYVDTVAVLATALAVQPSLAMAPATALAFAASHIGTPYRWGGTGARGFDCSGLTQAAERAAGIDLPRVAQAQYDAGPAVAVGQPLVPGDLVFFGRSPHAVSHVGLYVGDGEMLDAPHVGASVRLEPAGWPDFVGATRPG